MTKISADGQLEWNHIRKNQNPLENPDQRCRYIEYYLNVDIHFPIVIGFPKDTSLPQI